MKERSKINRLIIIVLFIIPLFFTIILLYQYLYPKISPDQTKNPLKLTHYDSVCSKRDFWLKNQVCSLVEGVNGRFISRDTPATDKSYFQQKGLIYTAKGVLKYQSVLLKYRFFSIKKSLEEHQAKKNQALLRFLPEDHLQFINGLVMGQKSPNASYIPAFETAGMLHVLVASGFNVSLVAGLAWGGLKSAPKQIKLTGALMAVWFYTAYLEFQPPLLRAAVLFSLALLLKYGGIQTKRTRLLLVTVCGILLADFSLVSSLSLWLSVLATLGIMIFSRRMFLFWRETPVEAEKTSVFRRIFGIFLEEGSTSFAAQSLIFPLLVWFFHSANGVSFLANPVMLPWLGGVTQLAGFSLVTAFFDQWWWSKVLTALLSRGMKLILDIYFAGVAWWQQWFFLNQVVSGEKRWLVLAVWLLVVMGLYLVTRKISERENHFFHEKA